MVKLTTEICEAAIAAYLGQEVGLVAEAVSCEEIEGRLWISFRNLSPTDDASAPPIPHLRGILWRRPFAGMVPQTLNGVAIVSLYENNPSPVATRNDYGFSVTTPRGGMVLALIGTRSGLEAKSVTFNPSDWGVTVHWPFPD